MGTFSTESSSKATGLWILVKGVLEVVSRIGQKKLHRSNFSKVISENIDFCFTIKGKALSFGFVLLNSASSFIHLPSLTCGKLCYQSGFKMFLLGVPG